MRFAHYICKRYILAFVTVSCLLTVLFNAIELFEKILHTTASLSTIGTFTFLNLLPSWLTLFPINSWLAMLLTLYLLEAQHEWLTCRLLGIATQKLIYPLALTIASLVFSALIGKHLCIDAIEFRATQFHNQVFKKKTPHLVIDVWYPLAHNAFAHIASFDQKTGNGSGLILYRYTKQMELKNKTVVPSFTLIDYTLHAPTATLYQPQKHMVTHHANFVHAIPILATTLQTQPTLITLFDKVLKWWYSCSDISTYQHQLTQDLINQLLPLIEAFFFPLIALTFFLGLPLTTRTPLLFTSLTYPACIFSKTLSAMLLPSSLIPFLISYSVLLLLCLIPHTHISYFFTLEKAPI